MKQVMNFVGYYSNGEKSCLQTIAYRGVYIHTAYNISYKEHEVRCLIEVEGMRFAYMGKSLAYCKKLIRDLQKTIPNWYSIDKKSH